MKKRVAKSEIEIARKSSRFLFVISFMLLVFLFLGFGVLYVLDVDVSRYVHFQMPTSTTPKKESNSDKVIKNGVMIYPDDPVAMKVDINDGNVKTFYDTVKITNDDVCIDGGYREKKQVVVDGLSEKCKFSLASKIYEKNVQQGLDGKLFVSEEDVKKAYEGLYGTGTYEKQDSIPCLYKTNFIYHGDYYFTESVAPEEGTSLVSYEKMLHAVRDGEQLDITTAVLYYERALSLFCKDSRCETIIETVKQDADYGEDYLSLYVAYHQNELYQYTYHFKMDSAGFYRYI